jgi:hypothetical protein
MASSIDASTSGAGGLISTADNTGILQLKSGGTTVSTINAYGIGLGTGVPSSGIGITFPATQSASSDANTLDDYEEGTFTPSVSGVTVGTTTGIYIKIGKLVFINMIIPVTSGSSSGMTITNLPFTSWTGNRQVMLARENAVVGKTGQLYIDSNSTSSSIQDYAGTSGGTNGYTWIITGSYQSA